MKFISWKLAVVVLSICRASIVSGADDTTETIKALRKQIEELDQKVRALESKAGMTNELAQEKPAQEKPKPAAPSPVLSVGTSGFMLRSADTNFVLRLRGLLQVDSRSYIDDGGIKNNDTLLLRRARPIFEGTVFRDFDFLFVPEFGGTGPSSILDAALNYRYAPSLQLRVGKFKVPVGLEQLQSDSQAYFIERGFPSQLTPSRDMGIQLHGEVLDGVVNYAGGVFNGVGDNRTTTNSDFDDEKAVAGRIFLHPFQKTDVSPLKGLGLGIGANYGNAEGALGLPNGNGYLSEGVQQFFSYVTGAGTNANVIADGEYWRFTPQAYWYYGPFGVLAEYVVSSQRLRRTAAATEIFRTARNTAWQVELGWVVTGEDASYRSVTPKRNFDPRNGVWGAFELVGRYGVLEIDEDVFEGPSFATPGSAAKATGWGGGINWYLNRNIKAAVNYFHTDFDDVSPGSNLVTAEEEDVILTRFQLTF